MLLNQSFQQRLIGSDSWRKVENAIGVTRYFRFRPKKGMTIEQDAKCLDMRRLVRRFDPLTGAAIPSTQPQTFRTLAAFQASTIVYGLHQLPISLLGYKNDEDRAAAIAQGKHDASMTCGFSFIAVTFAQLLQAYELLHPRHMWMCAMVMPNMPVHLYFDFDAGISTDPARQSSAAQELARRVVGHESDVKEEFMSCFAQFFEDTFHRLPNWAGLHWETASCADKFSLHAHVTTEAFASVSHFNNFMKAFAAFLDKLYLLGKLQWMLHKEGASDTASLLDFAVYTPNRVFRLIGCRKLHKTALEPLPSTTEESMLSWQELVFRGIPNLSIDVAQPDGLLEFSDEANVEATRPKNSAAKKRPAALPAAGSVSSVDTGTADLTEPEQELIQHMLSSPLILGPDARISKFRAVTMDRTVADLSAESASKRARGTLSVFFTSPFKPAAQPTLVRGTCRRIEGECEIGTAWCPRFHSPSSPRAR